MYYIDLPDVDTLGDDDGGWTNVAIAKTKAEALAWIRANIGQCDDDGNICLITEGDAEDE